MYRAISLAGASAFVSQRAFANGFAQPHMFISTLVMAALASPTFAHAVLERAAPAAGSEVAASPPELSITFGEGVEPLFSTIELRDAAGALMSASKPHSAKGNDRTLIIDLPKLQPGTYTVIWHATSVDTHKTEGSYKFTVRR